MHLFPVVGVADEPRALVKQHDVRILVEDGQLRADFGVERILARHGFKEAVLHVHLNRLTRGELGFLVSLFSVHLDAPEAQKLADLPHAGGGHGLLQEADELSSVPLFIDLYGFHRLNLSLITRTTPLSSLLGATCFAMALMLSRAFSMA